MPDNYLMIKDEQLDPLEEIETPKFENFNLIGHFEITAEQHYSRDGGEPNIPRLIPLDAIAELQNSDLSVGIEEAQLIEDYEKYDKMKLDFLLRWLIEIAYFKNVQDKVYKKSDFICFGINMAQALISPLQLELGNWEIYAAKYNNTIFIWQSGNFNPGSRWTSNEAYSGLAYESLLTGTNPAIQSVNEFEKSFVIQEVTFGSHQLLLVDEIDAQDEDGNWVKIKTFKKPKPKSKSNLSQKMKNKYLWYWGRSVVSGVKKLVLGQRDDKGTLLETNVLTLENARAKAIGQSSRSIDECYRFEKRLLTWIKSHFIENNPQVVKRFSRSRTGPPNWKCRTGSKVECFNVNKEELPIAGMFPNWFIRQTTNNLP